MRIIDADRAKEIAEVSLGDIFLQTALKLLIDKVPTLDAVPVVHGRVIRVIDDDITNHQECSVCNGFLPYDYTYFLYCPHCGAKMDGERKEQ